MDAHDIKVQEHRRPGHEAFSTALCACGWTFTDVSKDSVYQNAEAHQQEAARRPKKMVERPADAPLEPTQL